MSIWALDIESILFTILKTELSDTLTTKYPNLYFTKVDTTSTTAKFPTVYVHMISGTETAETTEAVDVNGVIVTMQVDVITNTNQNDAKAVMSGVIDTMKKYMFSVVAMPELSGVSDTYRSVARFRRTVCEGEL